MNVNFVHFNNSVNCNYAWFRYYNNKDDTRSTRDYYKALKEKNPKWSFFGSGDRFYKTIKSDTCYFYIITPQQLESFYLEIDRMKLRDYIVYESKEYAENYNYPNEPRLKVFVIKTPKDFVHQTLEQYEF